MRGCGAGAGCAGGYHHHYGRGLLAGAGAPQPLVPDPPFDPQSVRVERGLCAVTAVVFAASLSYILVSTILGCIYGCRESPRQQPADAEETKRALREIPVVVVQVATPTRDPAEGGGEEPGECAVCLGEYVAGEELRVLPACRHGFHRECVDRWLLTRAPTCPICRGNVVAAHAAAAAKDCTTGYAATPVV